HNVGEFHADQVRFGEILERLRDGQALNGEPARLLCKDGSVREVLITSNVRYQHGKFVYSRCFTRDVTDEKRALQAMREAEERAEQTQAFLAALVESSDDAI